MGSGVDLVVAEDDMVGFAMVPSMYPVSPLDPSNWIIVMFHFIRFSLLNFCSSESIVNEDVPDDIVSRIGRSNSHSGCCQSR